jgi:hypothetical protein
VTPADTSPTDPRFARWINGDLTRFCGHGMHDRCKGTIDTIGIQAACLCACHKEQLR